MNTRTLIAAAALSLITAGAIAQEAVYVPYVAATSELTREDVREEAELALASGDMHESAWIEQDFNVNTMLTRQAVRTATLKAIKAGRVKTLNAQAFKFS